jgi:hypothetical protein
MPASKSSSKTISDDPLDYGMKRYTDMEIAEHTIMIENLPKGIPREYLEKRLHSMFKQICAGNKNFFNSSSRKEALQVNDAVV